MTTITTNPRFDRLTNLDISTHYRGGEYWFMHSDFLATFAYCVVAQSPYNVPDITDALTAFSKYVSIKVKERLPEMFTYDELSLFITSDVFKSIPEIEILNHPKISSGIGYENRMEDYPEKNPDYDFIDLNALARNIFYMLLRESITQRHKV